MYYICQKKKNEQSTNTLYCYVKECDFEFVTKMLMVKKTTKALEFNILKLNNINYVIVLPSNETTAEKSVLLSFI